MRSAPQVDRDHSRSEEQRVRYLLGLEQNAVVARLRARVRAARQRQHAGLRAGGARPGVAAVALSSCVVAG